MFVHELKGPKGSRKRRKIVGRGQGSGHGKTSCRGQKGQGARSGRGIILGLEGGQMPLIRRLPKVGFRTKRPLLYQVVKISDFKKFKEGTTIDGQFLKSQGLIKSINKPFKILGDGELKKPFTVHAFSFSKSAEEKIVKAGGKIERITKDSLRENQENTRTVESK